MPYERLLREGRIRRHRTNRQEITSLFQVVERDLADAASTGFYAFTIFRSVRFVDESMWGNQC